MEVLLVLIPVSIALAAASVVACLLAIRAGQYDDMESPRWRMLFDPPARAGKAGKAGPEDAEQDVVTKPDDKNGITKTETKMRRSTPT